MPVDDRPGCGARVAGVDGAGLEELCFKRLDEPYVEGTRWRKYKVRVTPEAIIGAVTGSAAAPRPVLLGRHDAAGRLQYTRRTTMLSQAAGRALAGELTPPRGAHLWEGWTFSAGRGIGRRPHLLTTLRRTNGVGLADDGPSPHRLFDVVDDLWPS
ncbi:hypothetical protein [Streptomyces lancefieldiae]|uniref:ATP-dependent DNA ligase n=1 Tax=Streptomyces lancefieldiae TaxID=3075520 RepID=A0ABU3AZT6_9ACTN|nr:hypothetical protein [Streptomyces sp. DSM 40712]MDT0615709.1 hypothetical protein [Streptomyces sp. DSM 40712]